MRVALVGLVAAALLAEGAARLHGEVLCTDTPGAVYEADPRVGWRFLGGLSGWVGSCAPSPVPWVPFETDSHGLAGPERAYEKPPGVVRVLLLGGNLAAGLGVRPEATLPRLLEAFTDARHGARLEVVNGGVGGYALDNDLLWFRAEGRHFAPDVVVVVLDAPGELIAISPPLIVSSGNRAPRKPYFRVRDGFLEPAPEYAPLPPAPSPPPGNALLRHFELYRILNALPPRVAPPMEWADVPNASDNAVARAQFEVRPLATALLGALRDETAAAGARLVALVAPQGGTPVRSIGTDSRIMLKEIAAELNVPAMDPAAPFSIAEAQGFPTYLPGTGRWSGRGHLIAALELWRFLHDGGFLPPSVVFAPFLGGSPAPSLRETPAALARMARDHRWSVPVRFVVYGLLAAAVFWMSAPLRPVEREWLLALLGAGVLAAVVGGRLAGGAVLFALVFYTAVERLPRLLRALAVTLLCGGLVAAGVVFRPEHEPGEELYRVIFLALAGNFALLRLLAYAADRGRGRPRPSVRGFLLGLFYFPTVVAGPVEPPHALAARAAAAAAVDDGAVLGLLRTAPAALGRLARGALQLAVVALFLNRATPDVFASGGAAVGRARLWLWPFELTASLTLLVGGWSDAAIALGMLVGLRPADNFHAPWRARDPADFWRRWHVTLGRWLHDYVYVPLGGRGAGFPLAGLLTFLASALWCALAMTKVIGWRHYTPVAWGGYAVWALLNAILVAVVPRGRQHGPLGAASTVLTLVLVSLAFIPFFLPQWQTPADLVPIYLRLFGLR